MHIAPFYTLLLDLCNRQGGQSRYERYKTRIAGFVLPALRQYHQRRGY